MDVIIPILVGVGGLVIGLIVGYFYRRNIAESKIGRAEDSVKKLIDEAQKRAEVIKKRRCSRLRKKFTSCVANLTRNQEKDETKLQRLKRDLCKGKNCWIRS